MLLNNFFVCIQFTHILCEHKIYIAKVPAQQQQKQAWYTQEVKEIRGVTKNSANTEVGKISCKHKMYTKNHSCLLGIITSLFEYVNQHFCSITI